MANNPTLIAATLDDSELKKSIQQLVNNVTTATDKIKKSFDDTVTHIRQSFGSLKDVKIDIGGVEAAAKQRQLKQAVKETAMSYDQLLGAMQLAQRRIDLFNVKKFVTTEEIDKYIAAIARASEIQEKLNEKTRELALLRAKQNESSWGFDAKTNIRSLDAVDERLKQLNRWYKELETQSERRAKAEQAAAEKSAKAEQAAADKRAKALEREQAAVEKYQTKVLQDAFKGAMSMPTSNIEEMRQKLERIKSLTQTLSREGILSETQINRANTAITKLEEKIANILKKDVTDSLQKALKLPTSNIDEIWAKIYKIREVLNNPKAKLIPKEELQNAEKLINKLHEMRRAMEASATAAKNASISKKIDDDYRLHYARVMKYPVDGLDVAQTKLEHLQMLLKEMRSRGLLSPSQIATTEREIQKLTQYINNAKEAAQQLSNAESKAAESARKLSTESEKVVLTYRGISFTADELQRFGRQVGMSTTELSAFIQSGKLTTESLANIKSTLNATGYAFDAEFNKISSLIRALEIYSGKVKDASVIRSVIFSDAKLGIFNIPLERIDLYAKALGMTREEMQQYIKTLEEEYRSSGKASTSRAKSFQDFTRLQQAVDFVNQGMKKSVTITLSKTSSYDKLNKTLNYLQTAYHKLNEEERNSENGLRLARSIQIVSRNLQQLQAQMNRPTDLRSVKGLSESTLDDIAYKMRQLSAYRGGLDLNKQAGEIKQVTYEIDRLQKKQTELIGTNNRLAQSNNTLSRAWMYMKNRLAFYFTVGASTQFVKNLIDIRSQYEMTERSIGILIDSAERGTQIFNELSQMALVSPYTLIELSNAAKQLVAYDVAAKDVVDTTRRLADMAAAVGIPMERLTYALGQIKSYGYLNARDNRMFANAGIPLVKQLADYYTQLEGRLVSTADVYDRIKKKAISYNDVMSVINKMTDEGGKFFDFQAKMAGTMKVQLANLTLAWNNMLNDIGKSNQLLITAPIKGLKELFLHWQTINRILTTVLITFGSLKAVQMLMNVSFGKGTMKALQEAAAIDSSTTATYENIIAKTKLNSTQAKFLIATNKSNVALREAIVNSNILTAEQAKLAATTSGFRGVWLRMWTGSGTLLTGVVRGLKSIGAAMLSLATNPMTIALVAISAIVDLFMQAQQHAERIAELNKDISKNAGEAAESINKFQKTNIDLTNSAIGGGNVAEIEKAWIGVKEELESSALSVKDFMYELASIPDAAERVKAAFDISERIEQAQLALSKLDETAVQVNDDLAWGLFGEGLAEDLQDYKEAVERFKNNAEERNLTFSVGKWGKALKPELEEANSEIEKFAETAARAIEITLGPDGIKDKIKVGEAIRRIVQEVKLHNPEISGAAADLFDVKIDQIFAKKFDGVYDNTTTLWNLLMDEIKSKSASAFQTVTDDIYDENYKWSEDQKKSIDSAIEHLKARLPLEFHNVLDDMTKDINSREFIIHIGYTFGVPKLDALTKDFNDTFTQGKGVLKPEEYAKRQQQYARFNKKEGQTTVEWEKELAAERKEYNELLEQSTRIIQKTTGVVRAQAEETKNAVVSNISKIDEIAKHEGFDVLGKTSGSKKTGKSGSKGSKPEDLVAKALKDELSLIKEMQSNYDKLRKAGVDATSALDIASSGYEETLKRINSVLTKYGISPFKASDFVGKDAVNPKTLLDALVKQRQTLLSSGKVKTASLKDLDVEIQKLNVEAKVYNMERVTKGLNSELDKLKDEYELAVALEANPEMGNLFADMFGIDTSDFPQTIDEYMSRAQQEFDKMRKDRNFSAPLNIFKAGDKEWEAWGRQAGLVVDVLDENGNVIDKNTDALDKLTPKFKEAQEVAKKWAQDTIKATQDLEYKLGDLAKKVEIEEAKLAVLEDEAAKETNAVQKRLLKLQIQEQKEAIEKLKMESVKLLPFYEYLFGDMYNVSVGRLKEIVNAAKEVMSPRQDDNGVGYTQRTDNKGNVVYDIFAKDKQGQIKKTTISLQEYIKINKQIDSIQQKIAESSPWEKIKDSFSKKEGGGLKNFASGMEAIGGEIQKLANITKEFGGFAEALGADENTVEAINDIAASIDGLATAAQGAAQIANGDVIGGTVNVVKGLWSTVSSWFDNGNKKITRNVQKSEREVKRLENAYKNLEYAVEHSMGAAETQARRAAIANKQLQLVELQRQLALEKSRKKKNQDEDKIRELEGAVIDAKNELKDLTDEVVNSLLGSDIKSAAEDFVDTWVQAWREGETTLDAIKEKMDEMIFNLIKKAATSKIVGTLLQPLYDAVDQYSSDASEGGVQLTTTEMKALADLSKQLGVDINEALGAFYGNLENLDVIGKNIKKNELSALQQGIQGITEDTASALEAYMNGVSQQVYLHSDLLTQIRDAVVALDGDVQMSVQAQMLLQMQQSFQMQKAIQAILVGWSNPSGSAVKVELLN